MSQLTAPTHTLADSIPLGRRITEIMAEKGPAYTIAAMAKRLDINRETLRLMLKGEREIYTFELEKIAHDLKVPVERILQSDIGEECRRLKAMCLRNNNAEHHHTLELAKKRVDLAIGLTERVLAGNDLSHAYENMDQYETVYEILKTIVNDAEQVLHKYNESEIFVDVIGNMMHCLVRRKEYDQLMELLAKAEPYFSINPRFGGSMCFFIAKMREEKGDLSGTREMYYQMVRYYQMVNESITMARIYLIISIFEYQQKNYNKAYEFICDAWEIASNHQDLRLHLLIGREFGKLLIRLDQTEKAIDVLSNTIQKVENQTDIEYSSVRAQILLLLAIATKEPGYAEEIVNKDFGSRSIQKLAVKFLVDTYKKVSNGDAKEKYEQILNELPGTPIDLLLDLTELEPFALLTLFDFCYQHRWHERGS